MFKSLYIDDVRTPKDKTMKVVKSFDEAISFIKRYDVPEFISFDHDLGEGKSGYDIVKWIVDQDILGNIHVPDNFTFNAHSANPVGSKNITFYLINYMKHKGLIK